MLHFDALDGAYDEKFFNERLAPYLDRSSAIKLFTEGGCHVFAVALHRKFGYPLYMIPGQEAGAISHVFCIPSTHPSYAVDAVGFTNLDQRLWELGRFSYQPVSFDKLRSFFRKDKGPGLFAHRVFWEPADHIARIRIEQFMQFFDGTVLGRTPDAPPLNGQ